LKINTKKLNKLIIKNITLTMELIIDCSKKLIDTWCGKTNRSNKLSIMKTQ
jgi:hypothetical protein